MEGALAARGWVHLPQCEATWKHGPSYGPTGGARPQ